MSDNRTDLATLRTDIDKIDQQLVDLFNQRAKLVAHVGEWKRINKKPIYDPSRETLILEKVQKLNSGPLPNPIIAKLFSDLIGNFRQWELLSQELNDLDSQLQWLKTKKFGFIGMGLLGYSMILRFKKLCPEVKIFGYDPIFSPTSNDLQNITLLKSEEEVINKSDIVILATPALITLELLEKYSILFQKSELILDLASTKQMICEKAKDLKNFIGGHPLAGKAVSGANNADPQLFLQRPFILTPPLSSLESLELNSHSIMSLFEMAEKIIAVLGAIPYRVSAEFHDEMLALTSHLPQMIATNLTCMSADLGLLMGEPFLYGPAFSEMTRCASSNLKMWHDIISTNRENILSMISKYINQLTVFQKSLERGDVSEEFNAAKIFKDKLTKK